MASSGVPSISLETAKQTLKEILMAFELPENRSRLDEARDAAGNDMLKMMQTVFPIATQIQMQVIPKYGFPGDGEGMIRFAQCIKTFEKQDAEVAELNGKLRSIIMPKMAAPPPPVAAVVAASATAAVTAAPTVS